MAEKKDFAQGEQAAIARDVSKQGEWIPMIDWSSTFPGNRGVNRHGKYELHDVPIGVRLSIEEAKKHVILTADQEWDGDPPGKAEYIPLKIWKDKEKYKLLYNSLPRNTNNRGGFGGIAQRCYATSDDGYNWERINLGQVEWNGSKNNNIVANAPTGTPFEDPSAPPEERFKALGQVAAAFDPDTGEKLDRDEAYKRFQQQEQWGDKYTGPKMEYRHWVEGWTSPDLIHWKNIGKVADGSEGGKAAQYDAETNSYYVYIRVAGTGRRATGIARTKNFWKWPKAELVLFPDPQDGPDVSYYGTSYFKYPTNPNLHCAFVEIYHQVADNNDAQIAFSRNMTHWFRPERKAIIPLGKPGSDDVGSTRVWGGLFELSDGKWAAMYRGGEGLHNYRNVNNSSIPSITRKPGNLKIAIWDPHRFCGIEAPAEGRFTIPTVQPTKKELRLNFRCNTGGFIKVELIAGIPSRIHPDAEAIPGFSFEESEILTGDHLNKTVSWNGNSDISKLIQKKSKEGILGFGESGLAIRIQMFQAKLFAYSI